MIFQIALILFAVFGIIHAFRQYRGQKVSGYWFLLFSIFWLVVIGAALLPKFTDVLAQVVGVERGADFIAYTAIVALSYSMYRVLVRLEKIRQEITEVVRMIAIDRAAHEHEHIVHTATEDILSHDFSAKTGSDFSG